MAQELRAGGNHKNLQEINRIRGVAEGNTQAIIKKMRLQCAREDMFFYQTWFQAWGRKD